MSVSEGCDYRDTLGLEPWRNPLSAISQVDGSAPSQFWIFQYRNASSGTWTTTSYTYDEDTSLRTTAVYNRWHNVGSPAVWTEQEISSETYDYDIIDQLTDYDNSESSAQTFSYDAAGNRLVSGYVYDNLNRMTTGPGGSRTYDLRGNTLTRSGDDYTWDTFGRLHGISDPISSESQSYLYRPDGLRIMRLVDENTATLHDDFSAWHEMISSQTVASPTYRYFYDGQNVHEDDYARVWTINESPYDYHDVNRYGLGARGIDWFERQSKRGANPTYATTFPLYDGHGNNLATISRTGPTSGGVSLRLYDVWGAPRSGTHDLDTRYAAGVGHRTDDESGLIYMRARFYEPGAGRFVSEDTAMDGKNWYCYADNDSVNKLDITGKYSGGAGLIMSIGVLLSMISWAQAVGENLPAALSLASIAVTAFSVAFAVEKYAGENDTKGQSTNVTSMQVLMNGGGVLAKFALTRLALSPWLVGVLGAAVFGVSKGSKTLAGIALAGVYMYTLTLCGVLVAMDWGE